MKRSRLVTLLATLAAVVVAPGVATAQPKGNGDMATLAAYRLTEARLEQFDRANRAMIEVAKDPAVRRQAEALKDDDYEEEAKTIAEIAARMDRIPAVKKAIESSGMSSREYATFQLSLFQAFMAVAMQEMQGGKGQLPEGTPAENVAFVRKHKARLDAMTRELEALQGDDDADDDDDPPARR
jgi:hypothetical protein